MANTTEPPPPAAVSLSAIDPPIDPAELLRLRVQLGWNWFEFHARQRMTMFNYFLLTTGILVNGYALAAKENQLGMAMVVAFLGMWQSLTFFMIDHRSRQLISYGEDVIEKVERDILFPDDFISDDVRKGVVLGLLRRDSKFREGHVKGWWRLLKMKWWMWGMHALVFVASAAAFINIFTNVMWGHLLFPVK